MKEIILIERISPTDKLIFTKQLAVMLKAGLTLNESIKVLISQTSNPVIKKVLTNISEKIQEGSSLHDSLASFPKHFDKFYLSLVAVGEKTGQLDDSLSFLAKQLSKIYAFQKKIQSAMFYPAFVLSAAIIIGGSIAFFVLPQLVDFFEALNVTLPLTTVILLAISKIIKEHGSLIIITLFFLISLFSQLFRVNKVKFFIHCLLLKIPFFNNLLIKTQVARYTRSLAVLLSKGVPVVDSLEISADTMSNLKIRDDLLGIVPAVKNGERISLSIKNQKIFYLPKMVEKMIEVGEKTGELEDVLINVTQYYEEELDNIAKNLTTLIEPVLLLIVGLGVGFVALSIISPIYQLSSGLR